jgi:hypothetical protein
LHAKTHQQQQNTPTIIFAISFENGGQKRNDITLGILDVIDAKRKALTQTRDSVLDESCILRGEISTHHLVAAAFRFDSLLQRQMVVFRRREEFTIELPTVNHLFSTNINNEFCGRKLQPEF